jgi:hypothetical protein
MLLFDPKDPFPLAGEHSYAQAQAHAQQVDRWLGLRTAEIEASLALKRQLSQQLWIGLPVTAMLTPYTELRRILATLEPAQGSTIVDLGAGYGRMGFVVTAHYPGVRFVGYEFVGERVEECRRCMKGDFAQKGDFDMIQADLASPGFAPIPADHYFLYDYGTREAIDKTLEDLRLIARARPITVVGRGRASRDAIERRQPWLSEIIAPQHFGHYSIYRSG